MRTHPYRRHRFALAAATGIASLLWVAPTAQAAATVQWLGGSGSWSDFRHWSGGFIPIGNFDALLGVGPAITPNVTVRLDDFSYIAAGSSINQLILNSTGILGTFTLLQDKSDSDMVANVEIIGSSIAGNVYAHSAGGNRTGNLTLGFSAGGSGQYELSGSGILTVSNTLAVGAGGTGTFVQTGGVLSAARILQVGAGANTLSSFAFSGGNVNIANNGFVNVRPASGLFEHSGGTLAFSGFSGILISAGAGTGNADYHLSGSGSISGAAYETIGFNTTGPAVGFVQDGGSNILATGGLLTIGDNSAGLYRMNAGVLQTHSMQLGARSGGNGTFAMTGGNVTLSPGGEIDVGQAAGSSGSFSILNASTPAQLSAPTIKVGVSGIGSFAQGNASTVSATTISLGEGSGASGSYTLSSGTLSADRIGVGSLGDGTFAQSGGAVTVAQALAITGRGSYAMSGGTLNVGNSASSFIIAAGGNFSQSGGEFNGTLNNDGNFTYSGGNFAGRLVNGVFGQPTIHGALIAGQGVLNQGNVILNNGSVLGSGAGAKLDNQGSLALAGGALSGAGAIANNGSLSGFGSIAGSGGFSNAGVWSLGGGNMVLSNSGVNTNLGTLQIGPGRQLQLAGATLANRASLSLMSGLISGSGVLTNEVGGTLDGVGNINTAFVNQGVVVPGNGALVLTQGMSNQGVVHLSGPFTGITGGVIQNSGTLQGAGNVGAPVNNSGTLEAIGGTLIFTQPLTNNTNSRVATNSGSKLLAQGGLANNNGLIVLGGGSFDAAGPVNNTGQITGWGSFGTGGLNNNGSVNLTGGVTQLNGSVTNSAGRTLQVAYNPATFTGSVVNNGMLQTINTTVVFAGGFTNNGVLRSDPSTLRFSDLTVGSGGVFSAASGDRFEVSGSFVNLSTQAQAWDTGAASLLFDGVGRQTLVLAGHDVGADPAGYRANFAWGRIELASATGLDIHGAAPGSALYAGAFVLDGGLPQLTAIHSAANIYYDPAFADNFYLGGASYAMDGGGLLTPVPEPSPWALLAAGLLWLTTRRRVAAEAP
jgi:hypothetical protein